MENLYEMKYFGFLLAIAAFSSFHAEGAQWPKTGTLIVTYHTGSSGERLNRIRFWLVDEYGERRLYPRGTTFIENSHRSERKVLIENLLEGNYQLEFLIPNKDNYFEKISNRTLEISGGSIVKIDQPIKPRIN